MRPSAAFILTLGFHLVVGLTEPLYFQGNEYNNQIPQIQQSLPAVISARRFSGSGVGRSQTSQIVAQILSSLDQPITEAIDDYFRSQNVAFAQRGPSRNINVVSSSLGSRFNP